jgi:hypothetical protein
MGKLELTGVQKVVEKMKFKTYISCAGSRPSSSEFLDVLMIQSAKGEGVSLMAKRQIVLPIVSTRVL